jgi:hypothetical protein
MSFNIGTLTNPKRRYHKIDGWRGYWVPALAIAGASDTGTYSDSPCPSNEVTKELNRLRKEVLRPAGIASRTRWGNSSNLFCAKKWLAVSQADFARAAILVKEWLDENRRNTSYIHDANLEAYFQ